MEHEKIYVIVPVYKVEPYLERCIDSILNQTYQNFEPVLVDDGSPDNCPAICDRYAAEHKNITVIHQENSGLSAARNTGIAYAMAHSNPEESWITFIDSDDFIHPNYLEYLYLAAKETNSGISICRYRKTSSSEIPPLTHDQLAWEQFSPEEFWRKDRTNALIACAKLYKLSHFHGIHFPKGKLHEDEFTTYKILFKCEQVVFLNTALYCYYFNSNSITHSEWSPRRLDGLDALEEQVRYFTENHFLTARTVSLEHLLQHSIKHVMYIKHSSPKYDHLLPQVRRRRDQAFRQYAKAAGYKRACSYWYEVRIQTPMQRILKNESVFSFVTRRLKKKLHIR